MSDPVRGHLATFDHLTGDERREFFSEILHRARDLDWPPLDDESIDRIADESFLEYDAREVADARG